MVKFSVKFILLIISIIVLPVQQTFSQESRLEIIREVRKTCDGASNLMAAGQRANIEVREGLEVTVKGDNSIEIRKDGLLLEKIEKYTAADRQRCIDSLAKIVSGSVSNPLLDQSGANTGNYRMFLEEVKIEFIGFDENGRSQFSGINNLVFSFQNNAPMKANIYGSDGCSFSNWPYLKNGRLNHATNSGYLLQNGPNVVSIEPGQSVKISYTLDSLDAPEYGATQKQSSTCQFAVGFGSQPLSYNVTAVLKPLANFTSGKQAKTLNDVREISFQDLALDKERLRGDQVRLRAMLSCAFEIERCAIYPVERNVRRRPIFLDLSVLNLPDRKKIFRECHPSQGGCDAVLTGIVTMRSVLGDLEVSKVAF